MWRSSGGVAAGADHRGVLGKRGVRRRGWGGAEGGSTTSYGVGRDPCIHECATTGVRAHGGTGRGWRAGGRCRCSAPPCSCCAVGWPLPAPRPASGGRTGGGGGNTTMVVLGSGGEKEGGLRGAATERLRSSRRAGATAHRRRGQVPRGEAAAVASGTPTRVARGVAGGGR